MSNVHRPNLVVICVPDSEGERFVVLRADAMLATAFPSKTAGGWWEAMQHYVRGEPLLTENDLRAQLEQMGLTEDEVTAWIQRARRQREFNEGSSWERITAIGFRNREGQEVVLKTAREGVTPDQRVFVLRCSVCGHEYDCDGCDIHDRLCPKCQDWSG
jgi:hypothetical protein